jgi:alcohol dehydrogenase
MKGFTFHLPTKIVFGTGKINELGKHLDGQYDRILLVTDKTVAKESGAIEKIIPQLQGKNVDVFDDVEENPSISLIEKGKQSARENHSELVIGIGGGSSMDAAKGFAVLGTNEGSMTDYMNGRLLENDPLPVMCIPKRL